MFAEERRLKISSLIKSGKSITVSELAESFNVSESTIRRDLKYLEDIGHIQRTHGGAIDAHYVLYEPSFFEKENIETSSKSQIGKFAASLIKSDDTILLDSGTTTLSIARALKGKNIRLTVVTNSPVIALELSTESGMDIVLIGGLLRKQTRALVGPQAENMLMDLNVDKAFIGTNGITINGCFTPNILEAETKKKMVKVSSQTYIVADHTKFGVSNFVKFADINDITEIITDKNVDKSKVKDFEEHGVQIIIS